MEEFRCKICSSGVKNFLRIKNYQLVKCVNCGFVFPPKITESEIKDFYDDDYFGGKKARFFKEFKLSNTIDPGYKYILDTYASEPNYCNYLEIGPGPTGGVIRLFEQAKNVELVEISKTASDFLCNNGLNGLKVHNGTIQSCTIENKFDVVAAFEVIEHDLNPNSFVKAVYNTLKSGGTFIFTTGNTNSIIAKWKKSEWYYYDPPAHVSYFNSKNIRLLLHKCGFYNITVSTLGFRWLHYGLKYKMQFLFPIISSLGIGTGMIVTAKK